MSVNIKILDLVIGGASALFLAFYTGAFVQEWNRNTRRVRHDAEQKDYELV